MVKGLEMFRQQFAGFEDRYLIIGGTACDLALTDAGLAFRATKDIDIVLCLETVDAEFGRTFWSFLKAGQYASQEAPETERKFYRFAKPSVEGYPAMIELFSRVPDALGAAHAGHLTPIPISNEVSSLSAIVVDSEYYVWIRAGRTMIDGLPVVRPEHLIPLKARAFLDLTKRKAEGLSVDSKHILKHRNDVFRLHTVIDPEYTISPSTAIRVDMDRFIDTVRNENIDLSAFGLPNTPLPSVLDALAGRYTVSPA